MNELHAHSNDLGQESIGAIIQHIVSHSISDVLYLIPFLFVTYLAMEWLEHKTGTKTQEAISHAGAAGPVVGALLGAVPQCGFSAAAAALYAGRVVTLGTVFAVFLSTSDEMLPIFIAEQVPVQTIAKVLGAKIVIGMLMGFIVDAVLRLLRKDKQKLLIHELCERDGCDCGPSPDHPQVHNHEHDPDGADDAVVHMHAHGCEDHDAAHAHSRDHDHHDGHDHAHAHDHGRGHDHHGHHHDHSHDGGWRGMAKSALLHTVKVGFFIFIVTLILNAALEFIGEDTLAHFLESNTVIAVFASALVGLIPNCAASVLIAQLYLEGMLGAGAMMAGLLVSAGVGFMVLVRANRPMSQNLLIIAAMYATGVVWGLLFTAVGVVF